jgi:hypothetical protein
MAFIDKLQYQVENWSLYFQGGVRRGILIFMGICFLALTPVYFLGQLTSNLYRNTWFNEKTIFIPKTVNVQEVVISPTQLVPLVNNQNDLYVTASNKNNKTVGFWPWTYTVQILNANDQILSSETISTYLLPDDIKYIVARTSDPAGVKMRVIEEKTQNQTRLYNPEANKLLKLPNIEVRSPTVTNVPNSDKVRVKTVFKNNDNVNIKTVDVLYIIRDTRQSVVGIGTYSFNGFIAGSERELVLDYPAPRDREIQSADIRWTVNYLDGNQITLP